MKLFRCRLTLHDFLFFSSYEANKLVRTEKVIHNYALTYALNNISRVLNKESIPRYDEDLRNQSVYTTPARLIIEKGMVTHTYNALNERTMATDTGNVVYPDHGKYIKLLPLSEFEFFAFSINDEKIRRVVKVGKKDSVAIITSEELGWKFIDQREKRRCAHIVSPTELPEYLELSINELSGFYLIPPSYLYDNVTFTGKYILGKLKDQYFAVLPPKFIKKEILI